MGVLIFILAAIILAVVFLGVVLMVLVIAFPAFGSGIGFVFLSQILLRRHKVNQLNSPEQLIQLLGLRFSGGQVTWILDKHQMHSRISGFVRGSILSSIVIGVGITSGIMWLMYDTWIYEVGMDFFIVGCIAATIVFASLSRTISSEFREKLESSIRERVDKKIGRVNLSLDELDRVSEEISRLATEKLRIQFPTNYAPSIQRVVEADKAQLLIDTSKFRSLISKQVRQAKEDQNQLKKAISEYENAIQVYKRVALAVNRSGSVALIILLDDLYKGLNALRDYLTVPNWSAFTEGITFAIEELEMLSKNAGEFAAFSEEDEPPEYDPYDILGVSAEMSDEQIGKVYKKLSSIYHPDVGITKDDKRMKEINSAYQQIMRERQR